MNSKLLDNKSASKSVTGARDKNKPVNDFLEITGIKKTNFHQSQHEREKQFNTLKKVKERKKRNNYEYADDNDFF